MSSFKACHNLHPLFPFISKDVSVDWIMALNPRQCYDSRGLESKDVACDYDDTVSTCCPAGFRCRDNIWCEDSVHEFHPSNSCTNGDYGIKVKPIPECLCPARKDSIIRDCCTVLLTLQRAQKFAIVLLRWHCLLHGRRLGLLSRGQVTSVDLVRDLGLHTSERVKHRLDVNLLRQCLDCQGFVD